MAQASDNISKWRAIQHKNANSYVVEITI
jgi:hypothetical protein